MAILDHDRVAQCVSLFLRHGGFPLVSAVRGGFNACYDAIQNTPGASLAEMVDFDPEQCRPSKYYRYTKLQATKPKAAQVLKSYALMTIRERDGGGEAGKDGTASPLSRTAWSSPAAAAAATNISRKAHALTEGTITGARSMFGRKQRKTEADVDTMESAIIAAKEAVEKSKPRKSFRSSASSGWAAMRSFGNRVGKAVKEKAKELQEQQQQQQQRQDEGEEEQARLRKTKLRRHSSPASSRQGSFDAEPLDMSPLNSPLGGGGGGARYRDDSDLVDDEDATDWNDFSLSSPPPAREKSSEQNAAAEEDDEKNTLPVEITRQAPLESVDDLKVGDGFVETDFKTTMPHAQWFNCELISLAADDMEVDERRRNERPHKGWAWREALVVCSSHVVGVRVYRPSVAQPSVSDKARQASKEVAKRLGKWMGRLKQGKIGTSISTSSSASTVSGEGLLGSATDGEIGGGGGGGGSGGGGSDNSEAMEDENQDELDVVGVDGKGGEDASLGRAGAGHNDDAPVLPVLVRVDFVASVLRISRMTRKKYAPDLLTFYFGENIQLVCQLDEPELCIRALRTKAVALQQAGLLKLPPAQEQPVKGGEEGSREMAPAIPSAPRPAIVPASALASPPPKSPVAAADAFSFGGGDSDSDEEGGGASENPFDNW